METAFDMGMDICRLLLGFYFVYTIRELGVYYITTNRISKDK